MSIGIVDGFEDIPIPQALTLRIQIFRFNASRFFPNISTRNPTTSPHCYATILRHFLLNFPSNHLPLSYFISLISFPFPISAAARGKSNDHKKKKHPHFSQECPSLLYKLVPIHLIHILNGFHLLHQFFLLDALILTKSIQTGIKISQLRIYITE